MCGGCSGRVGGGGEGVDRGDAGHLNEVHDWPSVGSRALEWPIIKMGPS